MILSTGVITAAAFETADHDVIKWMRGRAETFGYRKARRIVSNATQVFTEAFPQPSHQCTSIDTLKSFPLTFYYIQHSWCSTLFCSSTNCLCASRISHLTSLLKFRWMTWLQKSRGVTDHFCFSLFCFLLFNFLVFHFIHFGFSFLLFNFVVFHFANLFLFLCFCFLFLNF